jgi:hypothetical protein
MVSLHVRVNLPDGKQVYRKPVFAANKKLLAGCALINSKREMHPEAVFYLRYVENGKRKWKAIGQDPINALAAKAQRKLLEDARRLGQPLAHDASGGIVGRQVDYSPAVAQRACDLNAFA